MKYLPLFFALFFAHNIYSQCNTTIDYTSYGKTVTAKDEFIYMKKNSDYPIVSVALSGLVSSKSIFNLRLMIASADLEKILIPREVKITFINQREMLLKVNKTKSNWVEKASMIVSEGELSLSFKQMEMITSYEIKTIKILDNRMGISKTCSPYGRILLEQAYCILKEY